MKIACLGWGSLVWDPLGLPLRKPWFMDGPLLPVEFARQSERDRITLVLVSNAAYVRSLWALMSVTELETAKKELICRERIKGEDVGCWSKSSSSKHEFVEMIGEWAVQRGLEAVIWTALPLKFDGQKEKMPSANDVVFFLRNLSYEKRKHAEEYIRKAPRQIDTDYRRKIEAELHWIPLPDY